MTKLLRRPGVGLPSAAVEPLHHAAAPPLGASITRSEGRSPGSSARIPVSGISASRIAGRSVIVVVLVVVVVAVLVVVLVVHGLLVVAVVLVVILAGACIERVTGILLLAELPPCVPVDGVEIALLVLPHAGLDRCDE